MSFQRKSFIVGIVILSFICGAVFTLGGSWALHMYKPTPVLANNPNENKSPAITIGPTTISATVKEVSPAVVNIETEVVNQNGLQDNPFFNDPFFREFFGSQFDLTPRTEKGLGTGFIIKPDGYILTNEHVIRNAQKIKVKIQGMQTPLDARVIGADEELDLALIKVNPKGALPTLKLGDSDRIQVGDWVIAIGNPYGLDHTVTVGVISAKGRPVNISGKEYKNLLQTDAAINPGNSGGPLLNTGGEVIGINTAVNASAQGIGFAIPSATVKQVLDQLITKGKVVHPYLGVYLQTLDKELADYFGAPGTDGAVIADVTPGSPADSAGLQRGDIILEINKTKIRNADEVVDLVKKSKVGDKLVMRVFRNGHSSFVTVTVGEKK
ncbi:S1C family serine protease [Thermincola potens]|uniref:HtrA2 peptidase n=1 Tax=Thermincola potens (strain JR) TaxID=635013 RepID=D5XBW8_THEPJ|nr:trypsin-like peptidase domain-containing protein [Thermincola potens]ADG81516.1 HtrA2 peptidase [Thermincola potens JR]